MANKISLLNTFGPLSSSSTTCPSSICKSSVFGFPSLSYNDSIYCLHLSFTASDSVIVFHAPSSILTFLLVTFLFHANFATFAYTKSDLPFESSSSNSSHALLHHFAFALSTSLRNSLFSSLYLCLPFSSFRFIQSLHPFILSTQLRSSILFTISSVTQGFLIFSFFS